MKKFEKWHSDFSEELFGERVEFIRKNFKTYSAVIEETINHEHGYFIHDKNGNIVLEGFVKSKKRAQTIIDFWFSTLKFKKKKK